MPDFKSNGGNWASVPNPHAKVEEKKEKVKVLEVKPEGVKKTTPKKPMFKKKK